MLRLAVQLKYFIANMMTKLQKAKIVAHKQIKLNKLKGGYDCPCHGTNRPIPLTF